MAATQRCHLLGRTRFWSISHSIQTHSKKNTVPTCPMWWAAVHLSVCDASSIRLFSPPNNPTQQCRKNRGLKGFRKTLEAQPEPKPLDIFIWKKSERSGLFGISESPSFLLWYSMRQISRKSRRSQLIWRVWQSPVAFWVNFQLWSM